MNIEDAEKILWNERQAHWREINDATLKRREQNRVNKYVSRWKEFFYLKTADDYLILARELKDMREGRRKKCEGRPRSSEDRSKRRKSERPANKRRNLDGTEIPRRDGLFDSMDFCFDQDDNISPPEENVNISTDSAISRSSGTSSYESAKYRSDDIGRTPGSTSSGFLRICTPQTMSQNSNLEFLVDDTNDPSSPSTALQYGTYLANDIRVDSLQEDICSGSLTDFDWMNDGSLNGPFILPQNEDMRIRTYDLQPKSHRSTVKLHLPALEPQKDIDLPGQIKPASRTSDYVQTQTPSSGLPLLPEEAGNEIQQLREFDQISHRTRMTDINSEPLEKKGQSIPNRPVISRLCAQRNNLAPLVKQCLDTRRVYNSHIILSNYNRTRLEDRSVFKADGNDCEMRRMIEDLLNAIRAG